jgi:hypothetical protein
MKEAERRSRGNLSSMKRQHIFVSDHLEVCELKDFASES